MSGENACDVTSIAQWMPIFHCSEYLEITNTRPLYLLSSDGFVEYSGLEERKEKKSIRDSTDTAFLCIQEKQTEMRGFD